MARHDPTGAQNSGPLQQEINIKFVVVELNLIGNTGSRALYVAGLLSVCLRIGATFGRRGRKGLGATRKRMLVANEYRLRGTATASVHATMVTAVVPTRCTLLFQSVKTCFEATTYNSTAGRVAWGVLLFR